MITLLAYLWKRREKEKEMKEEMLDLEESYLDACDVDDASPEAVVLDKKGKRINFDGLGPNVNSVSGKVCAKHVGCITKINGDEGVIDKFIHFTKECASNVFHELRPGCVVEYLTYEKEGEDSFKVFKVSKIIENCWENVSNSKIQETVAALKDEKPTYFNTQLRNVLGIVAQRLPSTIIAETDYGNFPIELDNININFIPRVGDRICLECNVQLDENYVDLHGEILEVLKVFPARKEQGEKFLVESLTEEYVLFNDCAYCSKDDVPGGVELSVGDLVKADLIECQFGNFARRAISLTLLEKGGCPKSNESNSSNLNGQAVTISGDFRIIVVGIGKTKNTTLSVKNNLHRSLSIDKIEIDKKSDSQLKIIEPLERVNLNRNEKFNWVIEAKAAIIGETKESVCLFFDRFRIRREFTVIVCKTDAEASEVENRLKTVPIRDINNFSGLNTKWNKNYRSSQGRWYANQVWNNGQELVPGRSLCTRRRFVHRRINQFEVPQKLREICLTSDRRRDMLEELESEYPYLTEKLSISNYRSRFSTFLHLEEIDYFISIRAYDRDRAFFQRDGEYLSLQIDNLAERRPSLVLGDSVRAYNPWDESTKANKAYEGFVHKVLFDRILLKFNSNFQSRYNGEDYRLEFYFSRFNFRKQHFAVSFVDQHMGEEFLFPTKINKREQPQLSVTMENNEMKLYDSVLPWFNKSLNPIQKRAVFNILRGETENMPYIIFGPPGTGKTVTLVETVLQLVRNLPSARLLVGAPSNSSADLIARRIIESNLLPQGDFIRLVSQNQIEKDLIPPELMAYCATIDIGSSGTCDNNMVVTESGLKLRCQMKFMGSHRVYIGTCSTLGNFLQMGFPPNHFSHVLIDEAGQCTEPESVVPVVLLPPKRGQVILSGDPHQLQAVIMNNYAREGGLAVSFMERILGMTPYRKDLMRFPLTSGFNPILVTKLLYNYRALPSIMKVYSKLFYDDELVSMISPENSREIKLLDKLQKVFDDDHSKNIIPHAHGFFFCGVMGENMQENDSPSWFNPIEARELFITCVGLYRLGVQPNQIGILTPYVKQVKALRNMFLAADLAMPKIGSVEEYQGQERDIILVSTVRSQISMLSQDSRLSLGFIRSNKRINVAISRARCMMVIFGNPHLLSVDATWRNIIRYCAENDSYFGCELPQSIIDMASKKNDESSDQSTDSSM